MLAYLLMLKSQFDKSIVLCDWINTMAYTAEWTVSFKLVLHEFKNSGQVNLLYESARKLKFTLVKRNEIQTDLEVLLQFFPLFTATMRILCFLVSGCRYIYKF